MQQRVLSPASLLLCVAAIIISFYAGYSRYKVTKDCRVVDQIIIDAEVKRRVEEKIIKINGGSSSLNNGQQHHMHHPSFIQGMTRVSKQEFMSTFDNFGLATLESTTPTNNDDDEVLIIYNHAKSVPPTLQHSSKSAAAGVTPRFKNITEAIQNCDSLNIQFTHTPIGFHPQCHLWITASTNNLPSFYIDRYMRVLLQQQENNHHKLFDHNSPLKHVGAISTPNGVDRFDLPKFHPIISAHWKALLQFFEHADDVMTDVQSLLKENGIQPPTPAELRHINEAYTNETITVMTVNQGQSDLLVNFFCAAKSRNLNLHRVLVFVTDEESKQLVEDFSKDLGVMVYYDKWNFDSIPKGGDNVKYGDETFTSMMFAKILCVLYVNMIGYDTLYQDVDIVYYQFFNEYGRSGGSRNYDIIFQHDGSSQPRYAPYSSNSGFFYARSNKKVQYLFTSLLYHGDLIRKIRSHQQVLTQLLLEHSSMFGLTVKVLDRHEYNQFPGGYHFNYDHSTMHQIIKGDLEPFIFHMFWTDGKETKVKI